MNWTFPLNEYLFNLPGLDICYYNCHIESTGSVFFFPLFMSKKLHVAVLLVCAMQCYQLKCFVKAKQLTTCDVEKLHCLQVSVVEGVIIHLWPIKCYQY